MLQAMVKLRGVMDPLYGLDGGCFAGHGMVFNLCVPNRVYNKFCASLSEGCCLVNNY